MDKMPSVIELLKEWSDRDRFFWKVQEDCVLHTATIVTGRELTPEEKMKIERSGHFYGGPCKFIFKAVLGEY